MHVGAAVIREGMNLIRSFDSAEFDRTTSLAEIIVHFFNARRFFNHFPDQGRGGHRKDASAAGDSVARITTGNEEKRSERHIADVGQGLWQRTVWL